MVFVQPSPPHFIVGVAEGKNNWYAAFVNLSFNTTENDLQDAFAAHGVVTEASLMPDRTTGRPRGFAFVTMASPEEAQKAIEAMNGANLDGRNLTVNEARPKEDRADGGFRGGRDRSARPAYGRRY